MGLLAPSTKEVTRKASQPAMGSVCACKDPVQILHPKLALLKLFRGKGEVTLLKLAKCKQNIQLLTSQVTSIHQIRGSQKPQEAPSLCPTDLAKKRGSTAHDKGHKAL